MIKIIIFLSLTTLIFAACKKEVTSTIPLNENVDTAVANLKYKGDFNNGPYGTVSGTAKVYLTNGKFTLALSNVTISNGPDLHVYLSKEVQPVTFIDLGKLKSTTGNQVYDIPGMPGFAEYKYALIHCQQYNHLFGSAALAP